MPVNSLTPAALHCRPSLDAGRKMDLTAEQLVPPSDKRAALLKELMGPLSVAEVRNDFDPLFYSEDVSCDDLVRAVFNSAPSERVQTAKAADLAIFAGLSEPHAHQLSKAMGPLAVKDILPDFDGRDYDRMTYLDIVQEVMHRKVQP